MIMAWKNKHGKLLENEQIREWHEHISRKSVLSADVNLRRLGYFCERTNLDPDKVLELAKSQRLKKTFKDFVRTLEKEGKSGSYIVKFKNGLNNFIGFNGIDFKLTEEIMDSDKYRKYYGEKVPLQKELNDIIRNATARGRVSISLMGFSGLRPETIGDYKGTNGLRISDIEGLDLKKMEFATAPCMISVRENLSKNRNPYFTLCGTETQKYILEYLKERQKLGEEVTPDSFLMGFGTRGDPKRHTLRTLHVTRDIRVQVQFLKHIN